MQETLKNLLQEEAELQFASFNEDTAWELGSQLVARARRETRPRGISALRGVSSTDEGRTASGVIPTCDSSMRRRGEPLARTSLGARTSVGLAARSRARSWRSVSRRGPSVRSSTLSSAVFGMVI